MSARPLLLAGGSASRFGSQKLLADFRGAPLVVHAARRLAEGTEAKVLAVVPLGASALRAALEPLGCQVLESDRCALGLGGSLSAGVEAAADAEGWIVALGDMPLVPVAAIRAVALALRGGALIAAPVHQGRRGHPVGFSRDLYAELTALREDAGAREVVRRHAVRLVRLPCDDPGILADVDTPEALEALRAAAGPRAGNRLGKLCTSTVDLRCGRCGWLLGGRRSECRQPSQGGQRRSHRTCRNPVAAVVLTTAS